MTNQWNFPQAATDTVTVMLAAPQARTDVWLSQITVDERFRVTTTATTEQDFAVKAGGQVDIMLIDAAVFSSPDAMMNALTKVTTDVVAYVVLPQVTQQMAQELTAALMALQPVKAVYQVDVNIASLMERMYGDARAVATQRGGTLPGAWGGNGQQPGASQPVSTRIISVWNQMGGVGKTTVSSNLALEAARRGYPALLIGLGAPDDLPLVIGLKAQPNISNWQANPTVEGLRLAVQKIGTLDVLAGFPDVLSESTATALPVEDPRSIKSLVDTAILAGYAVIVIDAPPTALAAAPVSASNTLVIVGRADNGGVYRTVEAYRTITERMNGMHNIPASRIYVALNMVGNHQYSPGEYHRMASEFLGHSFPPIVTTIPYLPAVNIAQNGKQMPLNIEEFRDALTPLADALFAHNGNGNGHRPIPVSGKVLKLGPIKVRV